MKTLRKFSRALLSMVLLFTLTSCGGSSSYTELQLTSKINDRVSSSDIQVTYSPTLNEKLVVYLDVYKNSGDESAAIQAAGLNAQYYAVYATTCTSASDDAAAVLAGQIKAEKSTTGRSAKIIGYATAQLNNGGSAIFALVQF